MTTEQRDVVILGGGNAGMGVTVPTRQAGLSVTLIEARDLGGTCPNRGCTPKKVLVAAGHALDEIARAKSHHIAVGQPRLDWARLIEREQAMIDGLPASFGATLAKRGVEVVAGLGALTGPNTVTAAGRTFEAKNVVVASGSRPRPLGFPGAEHMVISDDVLTDRAFPRDVVFVGGGVIGLEFSHVFARAGAKVTILEVLPGLLPAMDADAVAHVRAECARIGIDVVTEAQVQRIERVGDRLRVAFTHEGRERQITVDRVVNGAGRIADVEGLGLQAGGVVHDGQRVQVDVHLRSVSNPAVYVCGDALWSSPQLSPIATYEGRLVGRNIVEGPRHAPDYAAIPSCVFTVPALAAVGLTESQARAKGMAVTAHVNDMAAWFSTLTYAETVAWSKVLVDDATDRIVGAHIVGHAGEELIHLFAFAIRFGITAGQIRDTVFAFPTFAADVKSMI
ncbi:MAG: dihydrolipoyl dehydrogenase family protein [Alphaproteobacteria bacterium]